MQHDNEQNCDAKLNKLIETILDAADRCIPKTSGLENKIRVPWWTADRRLIEDVLFVVSRGLDQMLIEHFGEHLLSLSRTRAEQNPGGNMCLV